MSTPQVTEIDQRSDVKCWFEAINIHNEGLEKGESGSKYYIPPQPSAGSKDDEELNAQNLMAAALTSYQSLNEKRSPLASCLMHIVSAVQRHAAAIDTMVQSNPAIAGLVWGSARFLLQINNDHQRASLLVSEGVLQILRHVGRWEQISGMADLLKSQVIRKAVISLYVKVLDFLVFSKHWVDKSPLGRFGSSILTSKGDEVEGKLKLLRSAAVDLDKELQTKATLYNIESLTQISSNIKDIQDRFDLMVQEIGPTILSNLEELRQGQTFNNAAFKKILSELQLLPVLVANTCLGQVKDNFNLSETMRWLSLGNLEPPCSVSKTAGTCRWILDDPSFIKWIDRPEENMLWIQGFQGTGKSVMANFLQTKLSDEGYQIIFYQFQKSASLQSSTPTTFASSLALQILTIISQSSLMQDYIRPVRKLQSLSAQHPTGPQTCPFDTMWDIVSSLLKTSRLSFRILIDAVDECQFGESSKPPWPTFANKLSQLLKDTKSKALLLSRRVPEFDNEVKSSQVIVMDKNVLENDILEVAKELCVERKIPQSYRDNAIDWVVNHSDGSFRWTWLFFEYLGRSTKISDFDSRMQVLLPTVYDLHKKALEESAGELDEEELELQNEIILMVYGAQRTLRTADMNAALQIRPDQAESIIHRLCRPFISAQDGILRFTHPSAREFFGNPRPHDPPLLKIPASEADTILAQKCLATLLGEEYSSLDRIAALLRINYPDHSDAPEPTPQQPEFYDYASENWDYHVSKSRIDCDELLVLLESFLEGHQFAHWAEYRYIKTGQHVCNLRAFERLNKWANGLPKESEIHNCIKNYCEAPYNSLALSFEIEDEHSTTQWLARMSLGYYFFTERAESKTTQIRTEVFEGLTKLLGPESILTLRASNDYAYTRFYSGNMRAARKIYNKVLATQKRLLREEERLTFETLVYSGESEYFMAEFVEALRTFTTAMRKFFKLTGPDSWEYLGIQLWSARCFAQLGDFETALGMLEFVSKKRREQYGEEDTFDYVVRVAIGEVLRLLCRHEESISVLEKVIELQHDDSLSSRMYKLDITIAFGMSLLAAGKLDEAFEVVEKLEAHRDFAESDRFDTACQIAHLKALTLDSQGKANEAIQLLQETLIKTEPDQRNRSLLWIRLDIAEMLRRRNNEGDSDEASAVFDHVMRDMSGNEEPGFPDEPDAPRLLLIAERALGLVRARKFKEAQSMLEDEEVDWLHSDDFWLRVRGSDFCS